MKRRDFSIQLAATGLGAVWAGSAAAQGGPVEGTHYTKLAQPVAVSVPAGKIEVVEFFSYGCPHCFALEPTLEAWAKRLPNDVVFKRVPVGFNALYENYQKIYYALEAMGQLEHMHRKVFDAIQDRAVHARRFRDLRCSGYELRGMAEERLQLKLNLRGERSGEDAGLYLKPELCTEEFFRFDPTILRVNGERCPGFYAFSLTVVKEGSRAGAELRLHATLSEDSARLLCARIERVELEFRLFHLLFLL